MEKHLVKVILESGDDFITAINGTEKEIREYYLGRSCDMAAGYEIEKGIERFEICIDILILE